MYKPCVRISRQPRAATNPQPCYDVREAEQDPHVGLHSMWHRIPNCHKMTMLAESCRLRAEVP